MSFAVDAVAETLTGFGVDVPGVTGDGAAFGGVELQFQSQGVDLGDPNASILDFNFGTIAKRGTGGDANKVTLKIVGAEWDINSYLTDEEIADTRNPDGPTIDLTDKIQGALDYLAALYAGTPAANDRAASFCGYLRLHGSYLVRQLSLIPTIGIQGDNMRDTILVQASGATDHMIRVLARFGKIDGARSVYCMLRDFSILGNGGFGPTELDGNGYVPAPLHGVYVESAGNDPDHQSNYRYNSVLMLHVSISYMSGSAVSVVLSRHAPKLRFCYFAKCGLTALSDGTYPSGVFIGSDSDAEVLHCGSGGHGGHSYEVRACETIQFNGGDCWQSHNANLNYRALFLYGMRYAVIRGLDINGALEYQGVPPTTPERVTPFRVLHNNFRFRLGSFGTNDDDGQPSPLEAYIIMAHAPMAISAHNTFTPYYKSDGTIGARPQYIYSLSSQTILCASDVLPDPTDPNWPAGQDINVTPDYTTITNDFSKLVGTWGAQDALAGLHRQLFLRTGFVEGVDSGAVGRTNGDNVPIWAVGWNNISNVNRAQAIVLASGATADVATLNLAPGRYKLYGKVQYVANAVSHAVCKMGIGTVSAPASIPDTSAKNYTAEVVSFPAAETGDIHSQSIGPVFITVDRADTPLGSTITYYLSVNATFTGTGLAAFAAFKVERFT